ncbi:MAG: hypothetical protein E7458_05015 [Ruminococcaceae bacterium]|nr:hypothetical protein [Oscillospiraceae bacterium]
MMKRERVIAAMHNQPVDRPPVGFWFHFPTEKQLGEPCIQAHLDYYNQVDTDIANLMCDGYFDYPSLVVKNAKTADDWFFMEPLGPDSAFIREQVARAAAVREGLSSDCMVLYHVFAPFSSLRFGTSDEVVMRFLKENPDALLHALDVIAQDNSLLCELLVKEAGVDGIYYCVQGGERDRFTAEEYRDLITPSDLAVLEAANGVSDYNILHCCGWAGVPNNLEVWRDYPAQAVNWACSVEGLDLTKGKAFFDDKCVLGGFDNRPGGILATGTEEEVKAYAHALVEKHGDRGIMLGADCTLPAGIDPRRIQWVVDAMNERI